MTFHKKGVEPFQTSPSNARPSRTASSGNTPCNPNEEYILGRCYRPCPDGLPPTGNRTTCPVKRSGIKAAPSCAAPGYSYNGVTGTCMKDTCDPNSMGETYSKGSTMCVGNQISKTYTPQDPYTPAKYVCYKNGSIPTKFIRIRPMTTSLTNKLCINNVKVWDENGVILKPISVTAPEGKCMMNPIDFPDAQCQYGEPYTSGNKYDADADGGVANRAAKSYWQLNLGSILNITKIQITQCSVRSPETAATDGLRVELYKEVGGLFSTPIASRVIGKNNVETITFNYSNFDPVSLACYDVCPTVGTVQSSAELGNNTCIAAANGVTHRSVTEPMVMSAAIKLPCDSQYLRTEPQILPGGTSIPLVYVNNFVENPINPNQCVSCNAFPDTVMMPLAPYTYNVDTTTIPVQTFKNSAQYSDRAYNGLSPEEQAVMNASCPKGTLQEEAVIGCRLGDSVKDNWHWYWPGPAQCRTGFLCSGPGDPQYDNRPKNTPNDYGDRGGGDCSVHNDIYNTYFCGNMSKPVMGSGTTQLQFNPPGYTNTTGFICVKPVTSGITAYKCPPKSIVVGTRDAPICLDLQPFKMTTGGGAGGWSIIDTAGWR